jgi:uncharacterized protein
VTSQATPEFRPAWWAPTGLLQTLAARAPSHHEPAWRTEQIPTPDGDHVRLSFVAAAHDEAPIVLVLHGLEGSRSSPYVAAAAGCAAEHGFATAVLEFRGCGGTPNRARRSYHAGATDDLGLVVRRLTERHARAPLFVLGYSLGANVLLKWLGEVGDAAPKALTAAAAVSPPFDLAACARRCDTRYGGAIARTFLRTLIPKAVAKAEQHPGLFAAAAVRRCRTLTQFDDLVTAPLHGFDDAAHYYRTQSCAAFLPAIRRPTLVVTALDDPLCDAATIPHAAFGATRALELAASRRGGHVAFVSGGAPWRVRRWAEPRALQFFAAHRG